MKFNLNERVQHLTFGKGTITDTGTWAYPNLRTVVFGRKSDGKLRIESVHVEDLYPENEDISPLIELKKKLFFKPSLIGRKVVCFSKVDNNVVKEGEIVGETYDRIYLKYSPCGDDIRVWITKDHYKILDATPL